MEELEVRLEELQDLQLDLQSKARSLQYDIDNFELDVYAYEDEYCDLLDEEDVVVCGISFSPSRILQELDPVAYSVGLSDYVDSVDVAHDSRYMDLEGEREEIEEQLSDLADEIEELEEEICKFKEDEEE